MEEKKKLGLNRTGIDLSPLLSKAMQSEAGQLTAPRMPSGDARALASNRVRMIGECEPLGSVPSPGTVRGAVRSGVQILKKRDPRILLDKLGERLAFERSGVRLYDALISKHEGSVDQELLPPIAKLREFRNEELRHFHLLEETARMIGADPTAQTPSADLMGVVSLGVIQAVTDPRVSFVDSLSAILTAELSDNDGWSLLIQLAEEAGLKPSAEAFREALLREQEHLQSVRGWLQDLVVGQLKLKTKAA